MIFFQKMAQEPIDTNCMTLTRWILAEQKKYAPTGTGSSFKLTSRPFFPFTFSGAWISRTFFQISVYIISKVLVNHFCITKLVVPRPKLNLFSLLEINLWNMGPSFLYFKSCWIYYVRGCFNRRPLINLLWPATSLSNSKFLIGIFLTTYCKQASESLLFSFYILLKNKFFKSKFRRFYAAVSQPTDSC